MYLPAARRRALNQLYDFRLRALLQASSQTYFFVNLNEFLLRAAPQASPAREYFAILYGFCLRAPHGLYMAMRLA